MFKLVTAYNVSGRRIVCIGRAEKNTYVDDALGRPYSFCRPVTYYVGRDRLNKQQRLLEERIFSCWRWCLLVRKMGSNFIVMLRLLFFLSQKKKLKTARGMLVFLPDHHQRAWCVNFFHLGICNRLFCSGVLLWDVHWLYSIKPWLL